MIIQSREQYAKVLDEIERLWEASKRDQGISWQEGDKLDTLLLAVKAYEALHSQGKDILTSFSMLENLR